MNAELLRIPSLTLNDAWEPEISSGELENDLLQLIARGPVEWRTVFDARCDEGDHEASERLLQLDVWESSAVRAELSALRERRIVACRENLARDVAATRERVLNARSLGLIQDRDQEAFEAEISTVEQSGQSSLRFPLLHRRLSDVRESVERRRHYEIQKVRERFSQLHLGRENPMTARIDAALNEGDLPMANRYLDLAANGQQPPPQDWVR